VEHEKEKRGYSPHELFPAPASFGKTKIVGFAHTLYGMVGSLKGDSGTLNNP
jgi:hypothetical protein